jgi:hypothetical protein
MRTYVTIVLAVTWCWLLGGHPASAQTYGSQEQAEVA